MLFIGRFAGSVSRWVQQGVKLAGEQASAKDGWRDEFIELMHDGRKLVNLTSSWVKQRVGGKGDPMYACTHAYGVATHTQMHTRMHAYMDVYTHECPRHAIVACHEPWQVYSGHARSKPHIMFDNQAGMHAAPHADGRKQRQMHTQTLT